VAHQSPPGQSHHEYVSYTSDAYVADAESEVEASTAAWLEEQAGMPFIREVARRTFELMDLQPGESVLDVACGTGVMLPSFVQAVGPDGRVTGLDHAAAFLARADRRLRDAELADRVQLVLGDALSLPFEDGTFDVTHAERLLMHLADPDAAIREMVRVTRPGGRVACAEVFASGAAIDSVDHELSEIVGRAAIAGIRNPWMGIELYRRMVQAGLVDPTAVIVVDAEMRLHEDEIEELRRQAQDLVDRGVIESARADHFIDSLKSANATGTYIGLALIFVVVGSVPAQGPTS
jgi:ubiquinone/menaquinone biosynthesis C-methylase UbiE